MEKQHTDLKYSDYSFNQAAMMTSNASGNFLFSHTAPSDPNGLTWESTTAEGAQNFFSDHGDAEDYTTFPIGRMTPRRDQAETMDMDDFHAKWAATTAAEQAKILKSEPMRRLTSKSSTGSHKNRTIKASSSKSRPRLQTSLSQMSNFEVTGNASSAYSEGSLSNGRMMDVQQYLFQDSDALSVSSQPMFYPNLMTMTPDGMPYSDMAVSHVDPTCTQMQVEFDTSLTSDSPSHSWDNFSTGSDGSSPHHDDSWLQPLPDSPPDSHENSPIFRGQSQRLNGKLGSQQVMATEDLTGSAMTAIGDDFSLPPSWSTRRQSSEGESARDHPLYKNAFPQADGLFHCPWEGQASCNHKPEKLKCNYDKFVDSHLKPYRCKVDSCENARFSSTACLLRHEREAHAMHGHGDKPYLCSYDGCDRALPGNGFPRNWNLRDHMRRVHNDNGSSVQAKAASSPPPSSRKESSKGRKRKNDISESASSRKSPSTKSIPVADVAPTMKAVETVPNQHADWYEHQKHLADLVNGFTNPEDPLVLQRLVDAQNYVQAMSKISRNLVTQQNANLLEQPYQRSFSQQSG